MIFHNKDAGGNPIVTSTTADVTNSCDNWRWMPVQIKEWLKDLSKQTLSVKTLLYIPQLLLGWSSPAWTHMYLPI